MMHDGTTIESMYALVEEHFCRECEEFKADCTCVEPDDWRRHLEDDPRDQR